MCAHYIKDNFAHASTLRKDWINRTREHFNYFIHIWMWPVMGNNKKEGKYIFQLIFIAFKVNIKKKDLIIKKIIPIR